jgi:hypothetical protein
VLLLTNRRGTASGGEEWWRGGNRLVCVVGHRRVAAVWRLRMREEADAWAAEGCGQTGRGRRI